MAIEIHNSGNALDFAAKLTEWRDPLPTGLPGIDKRLFYWGAQQGIPRGEYVVVAGRSSGGKTQFALHLMRQAARVAYNGVLLSFEERNESLQIRFYTAMSSIPLSEWRPDRWTDKHAAQLAREAEAAKDGRGGMAIQQMRGNLSDLMAEMHKLREFGADFFVVDNLQLIQADGFGDDQITQRASVVSETLRDFCFQSGVTVCALSQLKRTASENFDRSPTIHDLWGGTSMESNPSLVLVLDHSRYTVDPQNEAVARTFLRFAKNRLGPPADVPIEWNYATGTLRQGMPDEEHLWPTRDT